MKSSMRTLLECLAGCSEYSCIRFRLGEKKVRNACLFSFAPRLFLLPLQVYGEVNKVWRVTLLSLFRSLILSYDFQKTLKYPARQVTSPADKVSKYDNQQGDI